ncbi:MAG TPA: SDR family NAD(P)-dependent oxidoreductase [Phnomibacter sp.]|nr:SDR family NAD(P)-dependent oxidoreductase [Phnomibacter sp.]
MIRQRVIIIGGTTGIGRAMAELYLKNGHAVGVSGRTQSALDSLQEQFSNHAVAVQCFDVNSDDRRQQLQSLIDALGGMDVFIYCAGIGVVSHDLNEENEFNTFSTNTTAFHDLTVFAFNYFLSQKQHGHIVGISSIAANRGLHAAPAYNASKAFMSNYLEGLWFKARKMKAPISVTDIQPGFVATKMAQGNLFWVVPVSKAAKQIVAAIESKKKKAYISKRWRLIAWLMRLAPSSVISKTV